MSENQKQGLLTILKLIGAMVLLIVVLVFMVATLQSIQPNIARVESIEDARNTINAVQPYTWVGAQYVFPAGWIPVAPFTAGNVGELWLCQYTSQTTLYRACLPHRIEEFPPRIPPTEVQP